ncbi:hypothetical protein JCM17844_26410 [Iodidimonas gelatinilytica]|uniref:Glycosyltransferase 2-like domain-containing protein n=1 Tax=Iodidimonas gelatinilytica TaxID=1236966 RepID=A0A5A7MTS0_9PROT|nr:glycosyltransferase family A protein [Iodidimonas gelatinilytica]GEQ99004.1 hypothetical protein JCM17844_26410 [Iodidimonas gelatinilytica]
MKFTIFTPTYNRKNLIYNVYESLLAQSYKNFEWIIIDDGSTDGTDEYVQRLIKEDKIYIKYHLKKNGGPHTAHNKALDLAQGDLFLRFDSDDRCVPETLATFLKYWDELSPEEKQEFSGISCLCMDRDGNIVGDRYPENKFIATISDLKNFKGEKWGFHRTDVLRKFPFPVFEGRILLRKPLCGTKFV